MELNFPKQEGGWIQLSPFRSALAEGIFLLTSEKPVCFLLVFLSSVVTLLLSVMGYAIYLGVEKALDVRVGTI